MEIDARRRAARHTYRRASNRRPVIADAVAVIGGPAPDVDTWRGVLRDAIVELEASPLGSVDRPDYTGWAYLLDLGPVSVTDVASDSVRVARTPRLIRSNPVDLYHLMIARRPGRAEQGGTQTLMRRGDAVLLDATRPWRADAEAFGHHLIVNIPRAALRRDLHLDQSMLGALVPSRNPILRVLIAAITETGRNTAALSGETLNELGYTAAELLISALRSTAHGHRCMTDLGLSRHTQLLRMRDFVRHHLADPELSPRSIADAFAVSLRYVHAVFAADGSAPARFICDARMAEARRILADPRHRHRSIAAIGYSVGIGNPSTFTRTFRERYGVTPRAFRYSAGEASIGADTVRFPWREDRLLAAQG